MVVFVEATLLNIMAMRVLVVVLAVHLFSKQQKSQSTEDKKLVTSAAHCQ